MTANGWIKHDGGPCPVDPGAFTEREYDDRIVFGRSADGSWRVVNRYRVFAPVTPGPSDFVRETAARIMAGFAAHQNYFDDPHTDWAAEAVDAALALEKALKEAGK